MTCYFAGVERGGGLPGGRQGEQTALPARGGQRPTTTAKPSSVRGGPHHHHHHAPTVPQLRRHCRYDGVVVGMADDGVYGKIG